MLDLLDKLCQYDATGARTNAFAISLLLSQLSGKAKIHLASEDQFLYPSLFKYPQPEIQAIARRFAGEMGSLAAEFIAYANKYSNAAKIRDHAEAFIQNTKVVAAKLRERILRENEDLYPLFNNK